MREKQLPTTDTEMRKIAPLRVLVTGDLGFIGGETARLLVEKDIDVISFDIMGGSDIRNPKALQQAINRVAPNRILHLAAIARFSDADKDPYLCYETNVEGTRNVVEVAAFNGIPLVYASTGSVYMPITEEPPITEEFQCRGNSVYACSKYIGELHVKRHSPHIILRYAHIYGNEKRGHGLIGGFLDRINRGLEPILYGGAQSNDFCYIKDIATANYLALTASWDRWNQVYNIGTGEELTAEKAGKIICKEADYKGKIAKARGRTVDPQRFVYDTSKAKKMLGFEAKYSFKQGLKDMLGEVKK